MRGYVGLKYLFLVFKNIKKFIKNKPFLFSFLIISQIVCVIVVFLVCGFVDNANRKSIVIQEGFTQFSVSINTNGSKIYTQDKYDADYSYDENNYLKNVRPKIDKMIEFLGDDFGDFSILGFTGVDNDALSFSTGYSANDSTLVSDEINKFNKSNEKIVRVNPNNEEISEKFGSVKLGDKISVNGDEYTVAILDSNSFLDFPYNSAGDEFICTIVFADLKKPCTPKQSTEIENKLKEIFGEDQEISPPQPRVLEELQNIQLAYSITAAVIIMIILNISRVYSYVLTYRKKPFAVMNICGASKEKIFLIYLTELMLTLIVTFGIALLIFHTLILQPIAVSYPNFLLSMTPQTYLIIFGLYFVISILIMSLTISRFVNKSAVEMERSGD